MKYKCNNCGSLNHIPDEEARLNSACQECGILLIHAQQPADDNTIAVGFIGGAAFGASLAGPVGAIVGAIVGAVIGRHARFPA